MVDYDDLPYDSQAYWQTLPEHLRALGLLFGVDAPAGDRCRVLELGCATGGNLIPMALNNPHASFVGIDLSGSQIAEASRLATDLGLRNIEFQAASIADFRPGHPFDYVIAHGLLSWLPPALQDSVFALIKAALAPAGIAYLSYNALPGWNTVRSVREIAQYRTRGQQDPAGILDDARQFLTALQASYAARQSPLATLLAQELEIITQRDPGYVLHDHLEAHNHPFYLHQVLDRAAAHGLRYLADEDTTLLNDRQYSAQDRALLDQAGGRVEREQYADFILNRRFRRTLLVHDALQPRDAPDPTAVAALAFRAERSLRTDPPLTAPADFAQPVTVHADDGSSLTVHDADTLALLVVAMRDHRFQPGARRRLAAQATALLGRRKPAQARAALDREALRFLEIGWWSAHTSADPPIRELGNRPRADAYNRARAVAGGHFTNRYHQTIAGTPLRHHIVPLMDGAHTPAAIARSVAQALRTGHLTPADLDGDASTDSLDDRAREAAQQALATLARSGIVG